MYWIYFAFTLFVIVSPVVFNERFESSHGTYWHDLSMIFLAVIGLILFNWEERRLKKLARGRREVQKESRLIFDDLTDAYSYIGEANRKMEIVKNLLIRTSNRLKDEEQNTYLLILDAIRLFSRTEILEVRFVDIRNNQTLKYLNTASSYFGSIRNAPVMDQPNRVSEDDKFIFIKNPRALDNVASFAILRKNKSTQKIDDPGAIQAILAQALSFFVECSRPAKDPAAA